MKFNTFTLIALTLAFTFGCNEEEAASTIMTAPMGAGTSANGGTNSINNPIAGTTTAGTTTAGTTTAGTTTAGTMTAGADTAGADTAGADTAGADTAGADTAGADTAGADTAGADTAGADTAGADTAGADTAGADTAGADTAGAEMLPDGACTNESDYSQLDTLGEAGLTTAIEGCIASCFVPDSPGCQTCVEGATNLSMGCSACFVDIIECTVTNCSLQCLSPSSPECADCRETNCFEPFIDCSGVDP